MLKEKVLSLKNSEIAKEIEERLAFFSRQRTEDELFSELCFCVLAANYQAKRSWELQEELSETFLEGNEVDVAAALKSKGYRFPNVRARYIAENQKLIGSLGLLAYDLPEHEARNLLVKKAKGIGMKEASHFLRNVGRKNLAIIDKHILSLLEQENVVKRPKTLTKKAYLQIEGQMLPLATSVEMSLAELDLYLWYIKTGSVLK